MDIGDRCRRQLPILDIDVAKYNFQQILSPTSQSPKSYLSQLHKVVIIIIFLQNTFSVLCFDNDKIYDYKINQDPDSGKYFIFPETHFNTITELVHYYQSSSIKENETILKKGVICDLSVNIRSRDAWKIVPEDLKLQYLEETWISRGSFGGVYAGYWKDTIEVAIKELKMDQTDEFIKESEAMKKLNHERLLMIYGYVNLYSSIQAKSRDARTEPTNCIIPKMVDARGNL